MVSRVIAASVGLLLLVLLSPSPPASAEEGPTLRSVPELDGGSFKAVPWRAELIGAEGEEVRLTDLDGNLVPLTGPGFDGRFVHMPSLLPGEYVLHAGPASARFMVMLGGGEDAPFAAPIGDLSRLDASSRSYVPLTLAAGAAGSLLLLLRARRRPALLLALLTLSAVSLIQASGAGDSGPMTLEECMVRFRDDLPRQDECVLERSTFTLVTEGVRPAVLEMRSARPQGCHDLGHELGRRAWLIAGEEVTLQRGLDLCYNAYYHGVLYGAATYLPDERFLHLVRDLCPRIFDEAPELMGTCAHGVGHATLMRLGGDLQATERICFEMVPSDESYVLECRGAAMFEYVHLLHENLRMGVEPPSPGLEPLELCRSAEDLAFWCYQGVATSDVLPFGSGEGLLKMCVEEAEEGPMRMECVRAVAVEFRNVHSHEPEGAAACLVLESQDERDVCGLFAGYSYYMSRGDPEVAARACAAASVTPPLCSEMLSGRDPS